MAHHRPRKEIPAWILKLVECVLIVLVLVLVHPILLLPVVPGSYQQQSRIFVFVNTATTVPSTVCFSFFFLERIENQKKRGDKVSVASSFNSKLRQNQSSCGMYEYWLLRTLTWQLLLFAVCPTYQSLPSCPSCGQNCFFCCPSVCTCVVAQRKRDKYSN